MVSVVCDHQLGNQSWVKYQKNKKYENEEAANKIMTINALQYLKREYGLKDTSQIKISKDTQ